MALLLKFQAYPPAIFLALLLHGLMIYLVVNNSLGLNDFVEIERPTYINTTVLQENPQRLRRLEQLELQRAADQRALDDAEKARLAREQQREAQQREAREEQQRAERLNAEREAEQQRQLTAERERAQNEEVARNERLRQEREEQLRQEQARQLQADAARQAASQQRQTELANADNLTEAAYSAVIHDTVAANWSVPPSACNGMVVLLGISLVPTGEVIAVNIIERSGNDAFDRSARLAVERAGRFLELQSMPNDLFERKFRNFNLIFRPEDLFRECR